MENQVSSLGQGKRPAPEQSATAAGDTTKGAAGDDLHEAKRSKHEGQRRVALEPLVEVPNAPGAVRLRTSSPITPAVSAHGAPAGVATAGHTDGAVPDRVVSPQGAVALSDEVVVFRDRPTAGVEAGISSVASAAEGATVTPARPPTVPGTGRRHIGRSPISATAAPVKACVRGRVPGLAPGAGPNTLASPSPNASALGSPVTGDTDQRHAAGSASAANPDADRSTAHFACDSPGAVLTYHARPPSGTTAEQRVARLAPSRAAADVASPEPPIGASAPRPPPLETDAAEQDFPGGVPADSVSDGIPADPVVGPVAPEGVPVMPVPDPVAPGGTPADPVPDLVDECDDLDAVGESPLVALQVNAGGVPHLTGGSWLIPLDLSPAEEEANQAMLEVQREIAAAGPTTPGPWLALPNDLARRTRIITVDWVMEVCAVFRISRLSMYTAVSLIDRVLASTQVDMLMIQLVAVTSVLVASKLHDTEHVEIGQAVAISAAAYTEEQVLEMERYILRITRWKVIVPNAFTFYPHLVRAGLLGAEVSPSQPRPDVQYVARLLSELSLLENDLSLEPPAVVSAAVVALALGARDLPTWSERLATAAGVDAHTVAPVYKSLLLMWRLTYTSRNPETAPERIPDFLYVKYNHEEFHTPPDNVPDLV